MDSATQAISPLRQRMIDDMRMRKFADKTQRHYIRAVRQLAAFLGRSPDTATVEDLRRYQLHLVDLGTSPVSLNAAITGLKFFFEVTLGQGELMAKMDPVRVPRAQGKMLDGGWLFPGLNPIESLSTRQLNRAVHAAALAAGIDKRVSMHSLRHCFATHLLEQKVDIRVIQVLLGHKKIETTTLYAQVATDLLREVISPLERLPTA